MKHYLLAFLSVLVLCGCGVQSIPQGKNAVDAALAEVNNQYKRRADLVPNLVKTVKGYAAHEKETLDAVVSARARATQMQLSPQNLSVEELKSFQAAQGELSQALGRLMMITENYPQLQASRLFQDLQAQLEGSENRITVARNRYIQSVQAFNDLVTVPPTSLTNRIFYSYDALPQWGVDAEEQKRIEQAPEVKF